MSLGEDRVRIKFNPNENPKVTAIKQRAAELITCLDDFSRESSEDKECQRLFALAMTHVEDAAMWGVKAVTF